MSWNPDIAYDDLPLLPPASEMETRAVLKATVDARAGLAHFAALAGTLPNPSILLNIVSLLEAQASSEIENIVTTTDELFGAAATEATGSPEAREALRYRAALYLGWEETKWRPITAKTAIAVCAAIRGFDEGVRRDAVFIGDPLARQRTYTPPGGRETIVPLLANWESFVNGSPELDPLVRMAIAHYQFEAIHPFIDGNGRTGRILNILMLGASGLLAEPVLYLSKYIIENKDEYYRLLRSVTSDGAWEAWVLYMLHGISATATRGVQLLADIGRVEAHLTDGVRRVTGSANLDLVNTLLEQPYARIRDVMSHCGVSRPTATKWLHLLVDAGELAKTRAGRETLYMNRPLMRALVGSSSSK